MCEAFFMDVEIVPCRTIRECDGLAMSSRNKHLDERGRNLATQLYALLKSRLDDESVAAALSRIGFDVDYVVTRSERRFAAGSLNCGVHEVRLIDNVPVSKQG